MPLSRVAKQGSANRGSASSSRTLLFFFSFSVIKWQDPDQLQSLRPQGHHAACSDPDHISCSWPRSTNCINVLPRLEIFANQNAAVHTHLLSVSIIRRPIPSTHTETHTHRRISSTDLTKDSKQRQSMLFLLDGRLIHEMTPTLFLQQISSKAPAHFASALSESVEM